MTHPDAADRTYLQRLSLLYVEDDERTRAELRSVLEHHVARVLVAENGVAGLAAYQQHRPDLIVTDLRMPEMDGLAMASAIREASPSIPIIVTTSLDDAEHLMRALETGVDRYVVKPVRHEVLDRALIACARRLRLEEMNLQRRSTEAELLRSEAIALLAGGMAHDYNNLLQGVLLSVSFALQLTPPSSPTYVVLKAADEAASEAKELGARLLVLSETYPSVPGMLNIESALEEIVTTSLGGAGIRLRLTMPEDAIEVAIAPPEFATVVQQIVANAVEAMGPGGEIHVAVEAVDVAAPTALPVAPGKYAHLSVHDTGRGITPHDLARVFEPYFTTKERGTRRGLGLGLALSRAILHRRKGAITAESTVGVGTTIHVYLPIVRMASFPGAAPSQQWLEGGRG